MHTVKTAALAAICELAADVDSIGIDTYWGWHYVLETSDGRPTRLLGRVNLSGTHTQRDVKLSTGGGEFLPTRRELELA